MAAMDTEQLSFIDNKEGSKFGDRLEYSKPVYRDLWCAVIYYIHLLVIIGVTVYFWFIKWPDIQQLNDEINNNNNDEESWTDDFDWTGVVVVIVTCGVLGLCMGFCWLQILKKYAEQVIKFMLFLNIAVWISLVVIGLMIGQIGLVIFGGIVALIWILYSWCIWKRIKFAAVLLGLGSRIISQYNATVFVAFMIIILSVIWIVIWMLCIMGYYWITSGEETVDQDGNVTYKSQPNGVIIFVLLISFYWGLQVNENITHTTACGVAATWYFTPPNVPIKKPVSKAFKRTMTTSFGSICLGSLIVAILEALRSIANSSSRDNNNLCMTCLRCLLDCLTRCIEWFNKYAYAHCAIYGTSFIDSAKNTWNLFLTRGILALINDDLSGLGLFCGNLISFVICGILGGGLAYIFYGNNVNEEINTGVIYGLAIYGAIAGFIFCWLVLVVVRSAIITLFVCFAEEPTILYQNRESDFNKLADVKNEFRTIHGDV